MKRSPFCLFGLVPALSAAAFLPPFGQTSFALINSTQPQALFRQKKNAVNWIIHSSTLTNLTETYSFATNSNYDDSNDYPNSPYSIDNPDRRQYFPTYNDGGVQGYYVNETLFEAYCQDETGETIQLTPDESLNTFSSLNAEGSAAFWISSSGHIPSRTLLSNDTKSLAYVNSYFHLTSGASPAIGTGIILYRSNTINSFTTWDGYYSISSFTSNSSLRITFPAGRYVQVAMLYELDNYDTGWWIFQQHIYYHVGGFYSFYTAPIA